MAIVSKCCFTYLSTCKWKVRTVITKLLSVSFSIPPPGLFPLPTWTCSLIVLLQYSFFILTKIILIWFHAFAFFWVPHRVFSQFPLALLRVFDIGILIMVYVIIILRFMRWQWSQPFRKLRRIISEALMITWWKFYRLTYFYPIQIFGFVSLYLDMILPLAHTRAHTFVGISWSCILASKFS